MPRKKTKGAAAATAAAAPKFYDMSKLLATDAIYRMVFGERSNGKTFAILSECIRDYFDSGCKSQMGYIRRFEEEIRGNRASSIFNGIVAAGVIETLSNGEYNSVYYYSRRWYMQRVDDGVVTSRSPEPFAFAFSLTGMEHDKGSSYPEIRNIFFDEFMTRSVYLTDEFVVFMNTISTIVRNRDDVRIFMAANSVNKVNPYATEMGLTKFAKMKQGDIDLYQYGNGKLRVAIEYSDTPAKKKPSDVYFAFDNPRLQMITGANGGWEIALYPMLPTKYRPIDVVYDYFIAYEEHIYHCEVVRTGDDDFTFIHEKTTPIKDDYNLVYDLRPSSKSNYRTNIKRPASELENQLLRYFKLDKVFYQSNEIGEYIRNYLNECR